MLTKKRRFCATLKKKTKPAFYDLPKNQLHFLRFVKAREVLDIKNKKTFAPVHKPIVAALTAKKSCFQIIIGLSSSRLRMMIIRHKMKDSWFSVF